MTNSPQLVRCLALTLVLAASNGDDGGEPAPPAVDTVATIEDEPLIYNDSVFVLPVAESLATDRLPFRRYAARFYDYFDDDFDFLMFVSNLEDGQPAISAFTTPS